MVRPYVRKPRGGGWVDKYEFSAYYLNRRGFFLLPFLKYLQTKGYLMDSEAYAKQLGDILYVVKI